MWLEDLMIATNALIDAFGEFHGCYTKVMPCADGGIVFTSTQGYDIKWFPSGHIQKFNPSDWRKNIE